MGFARTFAIREAPIRDHIRKNGRDDRLVCAVGEQVLVLSDTSSFDRLRPQPSLPLFDACDTFIPSRSYHSTDFAAVLWTGRRFVPLGEPNGETFKLLRTVADFLDSDNVVISMSSHEREIAVARKAWKNALDGEMSHSFYWIYEDFTRDYTRRPRDEWPVREVGNAVLELMLSNWSRSADVLNCGCAISRVCTLREPETAVFLWAANCLRLIQQFETEKLDQIQSKLTAVDKEEAEQKDAGERG